MINDLDDLIGRLKKDDKEAFNLLFYMYAEKLFKFSLTFFNDEAEAEEIVQEVFLKIWLNRQAIRNPATFNSYIYTIAKNLIFNNLKKNIYKKKYESFFYSNGEKYRNDTENEVFYEETRRMIDKALDQLPRKRKEVFLMSRRDGLKNREIAEKLDISIKTVETHMSLTLKYLKSHFPGITL
ncbi:MAG: RNA polymerase sigma-70 factor [Cytophagales bacterium]|nr:RNA polymerase sigma-70 factor [Cytophagales bacterium]